MPRPAVSALKRKLSPKGTHAVNQVVEGLSAMGLDLNKGYLGPDVKQKEGSPPTPTTENTEPGKWKMKLEKKRAVSIKHGPWVAHAKKMQRFQ